MRMKITGVNIITRNQASGGTGFLHAAFKVLIAPHDHLIQHGLTEAHKLVVTGYYIDEGVAMGAVFHCHSVGIPAPQKSSMRETIANMMITTACPTLTMSTGLFLAMFPYCLTTLARPTKARLADTPHEKLAAVAAHDNRFFDYSPHRFFVAQGRQPLP